MNSDRVERVLVTITIDTECDHDKNWARSKPLAFHSVCEGIPNCLQPGFAQVGAVPTYLLTVEVLESSDCTSALRALRGPLELGTHLHSAFVAPEKKFEVYDGVSSPDFQCFCAPDVEYKKLENLTGLFSNRFGYAPRSFRGGRFGVGENTIQSLHQLGYWVDTSVTPHMKWVNEQGTVDFRFAPEAPYFPASSSLIRADDGGGIGLLEVPVTMRPRLLRSPQWFRPWFSSVREMKRVVHHHLNRQARNQVVVLNMMFHSMEIVPGASPYPQTKSEVARFMDDMLEVLRWCKSIGAEFSALKDVYLAFKAR